MLRDVVVHILNEQPLRADLLFEPTSGDNVLICRNLRTMNGKKPLMADHADSMFMIPLAQVRFVEIPQRAIDAHEAEMGAAAESERAADPGRSALDRLAWLGDGRGIAEPPTPVPALDPPAQAEGDGLDDDLLRRIRDV